MSNPVKWLSSLDNKMIRLEEVLLTITLIVMLVFASLQVILRNGFDTGVEWGDVFARHLVLWVGFFGATIATKKDLHIRIDALSKIIPKKIAPFIDVVICSFCIAVCSLLTYSAFKFVVDEKMMATTLFSGIPTWYFITIMPAGFGIITFRYVVKLFEISVAILSKETLAVSPVVHYTHMTVAKEPELEEVTQS